MLVIDEDEEQQGRKKPSRTLWLGCLVVFGGGLLFVVIVMAICIELGFVPDIGPRAAGEIHPRVLDQLVEADLVKPDETVLYFYSYDAFSVLRDGSLFTDQRVISYQTVDGDRTVHDATWNEIRFIDFHPAPTLIDDSIITISRTDGSWFTLYVGTEADGDKAFHEQLHELWMKDRKEE